MKILAIDTSSKICSVSILEDTKLIIKKEINDELTHSQKLMPLISNIFKESSLTLDNIDLLVSCIGPGSFTGIRIGVATIKAFSDVKRINVVGVNSLEGLAYSATESGLVCSLIDAKNNNVYFGLYEKKNNSYIIKQPLLADNIENIVDILDKYKEPITFVGDGAVVQKEYLKTKLKNAIFLEDSKNLANSENIGKCGFDKYLKGEYGNSNSISPLYLRKSQAEQNLKKQ